MYLSIGRTPSLDDFSPSFTVHAVAGHDSRVPELFCKVDSSVGRTVWELPLCKVRSRDRGALRRILEFQYPDSSGCVDNDDNGADAVGSIRGDRLVPVSSRISELYQGSLFSLGNQEPVRYPG